MIFARFKSWLGLGASRDSLRREAAERRAKAYEAVTDAYTRRDDRDLGRAQMAFVQATSDLLRLEVGR